MLVKKKMVILESSSNKGVLKLDKIGGKLVIEVCLYDKLSEGFCCVKNGDKFLEPLKFNQERNSFELVSVELADNIECVIVADNSCKFYGATGAEQIGKDKLFEKFLSQIPYEAEKKVETASVKEKTEQKMPEFIVEKVEVAEDSNSASFHYTSDYPFYDAVRLQLDEIFNMYPTDNELVENIPNSKFVQIEVAENDFYVVGVIEEDEKPRYICYGIPCDRSILKDDDIEKHCDFVCLNPSTPDIGYYMMYQDAVTGETLTY